MTRAPRKNVVTVSGGKVPPAPRSARAAVPVAEFDEVVQLIEFARRHVTRTVNVQLIDSYWEIGAVISRRIEGDGWGKGTVRELSSYLSRTQRGARGFSPQNLWRMRQFFDAYRDAPNLSTLVRELPWSANLHILSGAKRVEAREFYLRMATQKVTSQKVTAAKAATSSNRPILHEFSDSIESRRHFLRSYHRSAGMCASWPARSRLRHSSVPFWSHQNSQRR